SYYKPYAEIMMMTGVIASEMAGLRKEDITENYLIIQNSIVRGHEKEALKTAYRFRRIPITIEIRRRLEIVMARANGRYVFTMKSGIPFSESSFRNNVWKPALEKAGVNYKVPYTTRHTFTAWCSIIGKSKDKVVRLMGHGSKEMVDRVYGHYREGLEEDAITILEYFGPDFVEEERKLATRLLTLRSESLAKVSNSVSLTG
ncbi:MAG: tyrosine-type recombinase/integrase, partial [Nitrospirota bacterium]